MKALVKIKAENCALALTVFLFAALVAGCADFQTTGGSPLDAYSPYRGGATAWGRGETPAIRTHATTAHAPTLAPVQTVRSQTGASYNDGMAKLRSWNATQREREIDAYLARRPEFKDPTRQARIELKAKLNGWDKALAERRDIVTRVGGDLAADSRYAQLVRGRAQTQERLDSIDASLVAAMLEDNAGVAARSMSWSAEKARELDNVARNASAAEAAERAKTDESFSNAIF